MPGISHGDGIYRVNGVNVDAKEYELFDKLWDKLYDHDDRHPEQTQALEQEIQSTFFNPRHRLRGLLWDFISFDPQPFSIPFQLTALVEALTATPSGGLTAFAAMKAVETIPVEYWPQLVEQLQHRLPTLNDEMLAIVTEVFKRMETKQQLLAEEKAGGVNGWLKVWLNLIRNGVYTNHSATPRGCQASEPRMGCNL